MYYLQPECIPDYLNCQNNAEPPAIRRMAVYIKCVGKDVVSGKSRQYGTARETKGSPHLGCRATTVADVRQIFVCDANPHSVDGSRMVLRWRIYIIGFKPPNVLVDFLRSRRISSRYGCFSACAWREASGDLRRDFGESTCF